LFLLLKSLYRLKHKYFITRRWKLGWNLNINCVIFFLNRAQATNARRCSSIVQKGIYCSCLLCSTYHADAICHRCWNCSAQLNLVKLTFC
jgi:hypothetical protein